jgi:hypothetical protein
MRLIKKNVNVEIRVSDTEPPVYCEAWCRFLCLENPEGHKGMAKCFFFDKELELAHMQDKKEPYRAKECIKLFGNP